MTYRIGLKCDFSLDILGKILSNCFLSYLSQLLMPSSLFNNGNSCEMENSIYFDEMVKMVYFLEYFFILQNNY